jgi:hypothetical protein
MDACFPTTTPFVIGTFWMQTMGASQGRYCLPRLLGLSTAAQGRGCALGLLYSAAVLPCGNHEGPRGSYPLQVCPQPGGVTGARPPPWHSWQSQCASRGRPSGSAATVQ